MDFPDSWARAETRARRQWGALKARGARQPAIVQGALWLMGSVVLFSIMAVLVKYLGARLDSFEVAFFRALTSLIIVTPFMVRARRTAFRTRRPLLHLLRGLIGASAMMSGFYALTHLPLADASAISFARGLFLVPLAIVFLSERVGYRRWIATAVGFVGVLIILQPSPSMDWAYLVALTGAALVALAMICVKILAREDAPLTALFSSSLIITAVTAIPAIIVWDTPTWSELALLFLTGGVGASAQSCLIRSYVVADTTALAPLDYTRLLFAALFGYLFFGNMPGIELWLGAGVIIAASLYITYREAQLARTGDAPKPATQIQEVIRD